MCIVQPASQSFAISPLSSRERRDATYFIHPVLSVLLKELWMGFPSDGRGKRTSCRHSDVTESYIFVVAAAKPIQRAENFRLRLEYKWNIRSVQLLTISVVCVTIACSLAYRTTFHCILGFQGKFILFAVESICCTWSAHEKELVRCSQLTGAIHAPTSKRAAILD